MGSKKEKGFASIRITFILKGLLSKEKEMASELSTPTISLSIEATGQMD